MIRVVVQTCDAGMAANVGGSVHSSIRTFDVEAPELERWLRQDSGVYVHRQVTGVECIPDSGGGKT